MEERNVNKETEMKQIAAYPTRALLPSAPVYGPSPIAGHLAWALIEQEMWTGKLKRLREILLGPDADKV
jgi:hypothetical protein